jgi:ABC-type Zn uptake system ZnuABC Zn-binding protein ZnuA
MCVFCAPIPATAAVGAKLNADQRQNEETRRLPIPKITMILIGLLAICSAIYHTQIWRSRVRMRYFIFTLIFIFLLSACAQPTSREASQTSAPVVLTSTTFLADITRNVTDERVTVESLLSPGADPHQYQAVPADMQKIANSQVVIVNGLHYDQFLQSELENAGGTALLVTASNGLEPRQMKEETGETVTDPHMWMSPTRVIKYVENIRDGLIKADPDGADVYKANADAYIAQLKDLDTWIKQQVSQIPKERRLLVTNHDSLGYFAEQYGFMVIGTIVPGVSSEASPSAREIAKLIDEIKATGAPAAFLDISDNPHLADQIAADTNIKVVTDLYIETLSPSDGPAATYIEMIKYDVSQIENALR